jgi:hypothetical protein
MFFLAMALCFALVACMSIPHPSPGSSFVSPTASLKVGDHPIFTPQTTATISPPQASPMGSTPPAYTPLPGDKLLTRSTVYLDSASIVIRGSNPQQFSLNLKGNLPTPCHELRVKYNPPDPQNRIMLEVYSLVDPKKICAEVITPFEQSVALGSFPGGHYIVLVNGKQVGEFDA